MTQHTENKQSKFTILLERIQHRQAIVGVIGLGYVGLPHAIFYSQQGFSIRGIDISSEKIAMLQAGVSYIDDITNEEVRRFVADNFVTTSSQRLAELDVVMIDVPTPIDQNQQPDTTCLKQVTEAVVQQARPGQLIILESTSFPTTTRKFIVEPLEKLGFVLGKDIFVAFSPERIDPGNPDFNAANTPKLVGGVTAACTQLALAVIGKQGVGVANPETAELAKLYENTFRFVNIGLANELTKICGEMNLSANEVLAAAGTKPFGFMTFQPTLKIGGHCIGVDPYYLKWYMETLQVKTPLLEAASQVEQSMLDVGVEKILQALAEERMSPYRCQIGIYGVTYKKNIADLRLSAAAELTQKLEQWDMQVTLVDPLVDEIEIVGKRPVLSPDAVSVRDFDLVVLLMDHDAFDYENICEEAWILFDTKHATSQWPTRHRVVL